MEKMSDESVKRMMAFKIGDWVAVHSFPPAVLIYRVTYVGTWYLMATPFGYGNPVPIGNQGVVLATQAELAEKVAHRLKGGEIIPGVTCQYCLGKGLIGPNLSICGFCSGTGFHRFRRTEEE